MLTGRQRRQTNSICSSRACRTLVTGLLLAVVFALSLLGAYLNRGSGGEIETGSYWQRHISSRVLFALPTAIVMGVCGLNVKVFLLVAIQTWFSLYVGWGCYFPSSDYTSRAGVFDWLTGHAQKDWSAERNLFRYFSGMSLRGLVWTAPSGYALYHMGYGWQYALSGALMGSVYSISWHLPTMDHISTGVPWAESVWGYWIWIIAITSALAGLCEKLQECSEQRHKPVSPWLSSYITWRACAIAFEVWHFLLLLIFASSATYYALVQQKDIRNKGLTFFGMFTSTLLLLAMQVIILTIGWLSVKKGLIISHDLHSVAILTEGVPFRYKLTTQNFNASGRHSHRGSLAHTQYRPSTPYQTTTQNQLPDDNQPSIGNRDLFEPRLLSSIRRKTPQESQSPDDSSDDEDSFDFPLSVLKNHFRHVLWHHIDAHIYWKVFAAMRTFFGLISVLACVATVYTTLTDIVWNSGDPRFLNVCKCSQ